MNTAHEGQFVTFSLAEEEYGLDVSLVQELIAYRGYTRIPSVPEFIRGVINLRGTIVPVVDLRIKLGMEERPADKFTVIVILEVAGRTMGVIVDGVNEVVELSAENIQPTPAFSNAIRADFINGVAQLGESMLILLDIDKVLSAEELEQVDESV